MESIESINRRRKIKDFFYKLIISVIFSAIGFFPLGIYLLAKYMLEPQGFWQNLFLFGVGAYFLGGVQIIFFIGWVGLMIYFWFMLE